MLTPRFESALQYACIVHAGQVRKGTAVPYVSHLLAVAGLVLEHGGDEETAIAGLLHDAVEDAGGAGRGADIARRFGERVARLVADCTDTDICPKPPWRARKEAYIAHLQHALPEGRLISACDKLHNARTIVADLHQFGLTTFDKFTGGRDGTLWYYATLAQEFRRLNVPTPLVDELDRTVKEMHRLAK